MVHRQLILDMCCEGFCTAYRVAGVVFNKVLVHVELASSCLLFITANQWVTSVPVGPTSLWCVVLALCCSVISCHKRLGFERTVQSCMVVLRCAGMRYQDDVLLLTIMIKCQEERHICL